ncbi:MAG: AAA family ATPase [Thermomicrobiales bacterium]
MFLTAGSEVTAMRRVMIVGSAGSGKSTLARRIGGLLDLPVVHLDTLYWRPGWIAPRPEEWREHVRAAVQSDRWVIDGNYSDTFDLRFERADTAILLDAPRRTCIQRVLRRSLMHHGEIRADNAPGCPERLEWTFLKWVWAWPSSRRPDMIRRLDSAPPNVRVLVLRNSREIEAFLAAIERAPARQPAPR